MCETACESFPLGGSQFETFEDVGCWGYSQHIDKTNLADQWHDVLHLYTTCTLSHAKDKLVALAGVIEEIEKKRGDECVADIWRSEFERGLLWTLLQYPEQSDASELREY